MVIDSMIYGKRAERLVLQRVDAAVELVAAAPVGPTGIDRSGTISGPVMLTLKIEGTERQTSATVSEVGRAVADRRQPAVEQLHVWQAEEWVTRMRPFTVRFV